MAAPRPAPGRLSGVLVAAPIPDLDALRALTALFKEPRNRSCFLKLNTRQCSEVSTREKQAWTHKRMLVAWLFRSESQVLVSSIKPTLGAREIAWRETAPRNLFQRVLDILKKSSRTVELACRGPAPVDSVAASLQVITECFRCLRNACIECSSNQNTIRNLGMIGPAVDVVLLFRELRVEQELLLTAFRCGLQFLGNVASRNADSQAVVWTHAFPELFLSCLNHPDRKIVSYSSMILFSSLNAERLKDLEENLNIAIDVVDAHRRQPESEWPYLVIAEHFLRSPDMVQTLYANMSSRERVALLDVIITKISGEEPPPKDDIPVFLSHAELVASTFIEQCKMVLQLPSEPPAADEEVLAIVRLLDALCEMSTNIDLLSYLQICPGLLESVIGLLRLIHTAGSDGTSIFCTNSNVRADGDVSSAVEGFRSHLIRLIGNLCYKNRENQDKGL